MLRSNKRTIEQDNDATTCATIVVNRRDAVRVARGPSTMQVILPRTVRVMRRGIWPALLCAKDVTRVTILTRAVAVVAR